MNFSLYRWDLERLLQAISSQDVHNVIQVLEQARDNHRVFICGNGGSAALASHFACDLAKSAGFAAMSLSDPMATLTAVANDGGYCDIFSAQLAQQHCTPGDVLVAISVSGSSPNVVQALLCASGWGLRLVGLLGSDGGQAARLCRARVIVPSPRYGLVEDVHSAICHMITEHFKETAR